MAYHGPKCEKLTKSCERVECMVIETNFTNKRTGTSVRKFAKKSILHQARSTNYLEDNQLS